MRHKHLHLTGEAGSCIQSNFVNSLYIHVPFTFITGVSNNHCCGRGQSVGAPLCDTGTLSAYTVATAVNRVNLVLWRVSDTLLNAQVGSAVTLLSTCAANLSAFVSIIACFLPEIEIGGGGEGGHISLLKCQKPALDYPGLHGLF